MELRSFLAQFRSGTCCENVVNMDREKTEERVFAVDRMFVTGTEGNSDELTSIETWREWVWGHRLGSGVGREEKP